MSPHGRVGHHSLSTTVAAREACRRSQSVCPQGVARRLLPRQSAARKPLQRSMVAPTISEDYFRQCWGGSSMDRWERLQWRPPYQPQLPASLPKAKGKGKGSKGTNERAKETAEERCCNACRLYKWTTQSTRRTCQEERPVTTSSGTGRASSRKPKPTHAQAAAGGAGSAAEAEAWTKRSTSPRLWRATRAGKNQSTAQRTPRRSRSQAHRQAPGCGREEGEDCQDQGGEGPKPPRSRRPRRPCAKRRKVSQMHWRNRKRLAKQRLA